jgi:hypothetical protein
MIKAMQPRGLAAEDDATTDVYGMLRYVHYNLFCAYKSNLSRPWPGYTNSYYLIVQDYYLFISPPK